MFIEGNEPESLYFGLDFDSRDKVHLFDRTSPYSYNWTPNLIKAATLKEAGLIYYPNTVHLRMENWQHGSEPLAEYVMFDHIDPLRTLTALAASRVIDDLACPELFKKGQRTKNDIGAWDIESDPRGFIVYDIHEYLASQDKYNIPYPLLANMAALYPEEFAQIDYSKVLGEDNLDISLKKVLKRGAKMALSDFRTLMEYQHPKISASYISQYASLIQSGYILNPEMTEELVANDATIMLLQILINSGQARSRWDLVAHAIHTEAAISNKTTGFAVSPSLFPS